MNKGSPNKNQHGMTLIEIMIAMVLGLVLVFGAVKTFSSTSKTNRMMDNLSRMQENGRFAMALISRDIREAGLSTVCYDPIADSISGTNDDGVNSSDSITTKVSNAACPTAGTSTIFNIGGTTAKPGLFRKIGANTAIEIVEGIENMQILYGEDTDDNQTPDYYVPLGSVVDMDKVISVRINLLVRSLDNNLSSAPTNYRFNGNTITPSTGDHRIRREFSSTIALRNRLP